MTDTARGHNGLTEFLPKIVTVWREGYGLADLKADALAGLTVAIVALPLSMAIAIASGVGPERGLYTAIVGGFLVSALGGSRYQIGGPAGAFIVLVSACVMATGVAGLITATFLSGFMLLAAGALRLGTYIKFIPYPVTVAFTAGIGVIIFASQIKELLGLALPGAEPAEILHKLAALWAARGTVTPAAVGIALLTLAVIVGLRRWRPHWPGMLIAVVLASAMAAALALPVETIGTRFGGLPSLPPLPALPDLSGATCRRRCPGRFPLRCWGRLNRFCRRWWPTACRARATGRTRNWWGRASPTSVRRCSAASASPAPSPVRRPTSAPGRAGRSRGCCTRCSCWR